MRQLIILSCVLLVVSLAFAGDIARRHHALHGSMEVDGPPPEGYQPPEYQPHGIAEIGIERTPCFGRCPSYWAIINLRDGTFRYEGIMAVEREGRYTGRVELADAEPLGQFIREAGFMELDPVYRIPATDLPTTYTMVKLDNGREHIVARYGDIGPKALWAIEELIDKLLAEAQWHEDPGD